ncbi:GntR family transcriptional regulator [Lentzea sp. HUAS TT2]|uniref:FadR/GntR family transcriptional regulator n=1 Tax=Lentzea sp. HUAS TT2 TaxID=3447454 RepID=UPI003F7273EA
MTSVPDRIAAELEKEILEQRLDSGARYALRTELIERYGVSANAMNEALRILRERGVVVVKPGVQGGVFIAQPPPQVRLGVIDLWFRGLLVDAVDLFEARSLLEDGFAEVAAERATPSGNRNEVFSGGYRTGPDFRPITWTMDQAARGINYTHREIDQEFLQVVT